MSHWQPLATKSRWSRERPSVDDIVAYDWRAWQVMHVAVDDPDPEEIWILTSYRPEYRDRIQPYKITLRRLYGKSYDGENSQQEIGLRVAVGAYGFETYPDGRVPLCSCHREPWPCIDAVQQVQAERELKAAERELRLLPGCCPACEEPVTSRQRSITFDGPNVRNPLAEGPTFHLRRKCRGAAARYEDAWVAAETGRQRSLLTLACEGTLIVHGDGSAECFGATGSDCPSIYARHRAYIACYFQSHGCPRGCSRHGHPGTRVAGYPSDPRAVTR